MRTSQVDLEVWHKKRATGTTRALSTRDKPATRHTMKRAKHSSLGRFLLAREDVPVFGAVARVQPLQDTTMSGSPLGRRPTRPAPDGVLAAPSLPMVGARRRHLLPRVAFTIAETAKMLGKKAAALRRECERKARREGDHVVAHLALGIRAHKYDGRWFLTVPRELLP